MRREEFEFGRIHAVTEQKYSFTDFDKNIIVSLQQLPIGLFFGRMWSRRSRNLVVYYNAIILYIIVYGNLCLMIWKIIVLHKRSTVIISNLISVNNLINLHQSGFLFQEFAWYLYIIYSSFLTGNTVLVVKD